ncbi:SRPBCC family protein [Mycobacterium sp. shizuoka-1]|uniref:SRPBCC family protein n=1 Tax=Mycobacterium sp. shizuoka-1 TaxID=2039281 RepID=UPI000C05DE40|nr:SRPBCC family protein [Mycobacterium sp. shizuoka-1]GAY19347.1 hypothetical protein MSZK_60730 [Mycobacterium sp. shizuoka-1]
MISVSTFTIDAPPELVWEVFTDVEHWPDWTPSVTRLTGLDGPQLAVGRRFSIKQPRLPRLHWIVTELTPGAAWTWVQRAPGGFTSARHEVGAAPGGGTLVRQELEQRGVLGSVVGALTHRMTRRYLALEAQGLKACSEGRWKRRGANT